MSPPESSRRKVRADQLLVNQGLAPTRSAGQALILAGRVYMDDQRVAKAGVSLPVTTKLALRGGPRFVSRGGMKLESALETLELEVRGSVVADLGASTGGFTDCLLSHGACKVFAIDVGVGLLADKLQKDPRVVVMDGTNARLLSLERLKEPMDLVTVDASFIGIKLLLPAITAILRPEGRLLAMLKPQFEIGKVEARRARGVIKDPVLRETALARARSSICAAGFEILKECDSALAGPKGNIERFVLARMTHAGPTSS